MIPLHKSAKWTKECDALIDGASFETTHKLLVSVSLLHLSIDHQKGIYTLIEQGVISSAFALIRLQFESYIRGLWFLHCATDNQISSFLSGKEPPKIQILIDDIQKAEDFKNGYLGRIKAEIWANLNDFTHGGAIQVKARITTNEIITNYKYEHIIGLLKSSSTLGLLAGIAMAGAINNLELANNLYSLYQQIYEQVP